MIFTVKNYNSESCVSEKFFRKSGALEFEVKGPMGKGLQVQRTGVHVAFAAGTGVLTFMDLVAHIAATNLNMNGKLGVDPNDCISDGFKLVLHVAYKQKIDALGLEMMERLRKFCENNNFNNFELFVKITKEGINPARWDQAFIRKRLEEYGGAEGIKKIWVVGPPVMTETFERAFENLPEYKKFSEIL
jgi:NAD(P)H-flavin reductase